MEITRLKKSRREKVMGAALCLPLGRGDLVLL